MKYPTNWIKENYFERVIYPLVKDKLEDNFRIEDFVNKFNTLNPKVRRCGDFGTSHNNFVITLYPNYHYYYKIISSCLTTMAKKGEINVKWVSVRKDQENIFIKTILIGSYTEPIFSKK